LSPLNKDEIGRDITFGPSDAELQGFILSPSTGATFSFLVTSAGRRCNLSSSRGSPAKLMRALMVVVHEALWLFLKAPLAAGVNASLKSFAH